MSRLIYISITLIILCTVISRSQTNPDQYIQQIPALAGEGMVNYVYTKPGDLPIYVSVWGAARSPGRYEIPAGTDLGQLLSLAGGPGFDTRGFIIGLDYRDRQRRGQTHIRISRSSEGNIQIVLEAKINRLLQENIRKYELQDDDVIMVDVVQHINLWDVIMVISSSASMLLLIDRIFNIF